MFTTVRIAYSVFHPSSRNMKYGIRNTQYGILNTEYEIGFLRQPNHEAFSFVSASHGSCRLVG